MANAIWPASLPQKFLQDGFGESLTPNIIQDNFEIGAPQTRARSTWQGRAFTGSFRITQEEKIIFDEFYEFITVFGTLPFEFPHPYTGTVIECKFDGTSPPSASSWRGGYLKLTVSIIVQQYGTSI